MIFFKDFPPVFFNILKEPSETNDTLVESPSSQLFFDTLKVSMALSGGRHTFSPQKA